MTKVKICGLTNLEDALVAVQAGADLLGFIFHKPSPRYVAPEVVKDVVFSIKSQVSSKVNQTLPKFVGVFVNASLETVARTLDDCQLDAAQLHGDESPEFIKHFEGRAFKALRPQSQEEADALIQQYLPSETISYSLLPDFLIDAYHPTLYGGTGHVTDWTMAANIARQHSIMLAGSLTPANVAKAIQAVRPWGVDVSSGVEATKGKKDHVEVRAFVKAVRGVKPKSKT
jgi:phosphoribosylanthranilate isomerase